MDKRILAILTVIFLILLTALIIKYQDIKRDSEDDIKIKTSQDLADELE